MLCYGDSNTWGYVPGSGTRLSASQRWPGVLQANMDSEIRVIEEGLNGRTTVFDDPFQPYKNGAEVLGPVLGVNGPLDLVIIMLGTNDLKQYLRRTAYEIARGARHLVKLVQRSKSGRGGVFPAVLLVTPPAIKDLPQATSSFSHAAIEASRRLAPYYRSVAAETGCYFFDASAIVAGSSTDGVHLNAEGHAILGSALAREVRKIARETGNNRS